MNDFAGHYTMDRSGTHLVIEEADSITGHVDFETPQEAPDGPALHRDISDGRIRYRCGRSIEFVTLDDHQVREFWSLMLDAKCTSLVGKCTQSFANGKTKTRNVLFKRDEPAG
ncbi:MAG: hypothetical protein ABWZ65_15520 [Pseudomonas mandelii]